MNPFDPSSLARNLREQETGFWVSRRQEPVSYPSEGHDLFFELEEKSFWFKHRNDCLLTILKRFPPPGTLVDVGGANGFVARALKTAGHETALVEPGPVGARHAWERGIRPVLCATLEDVGFPPGSLPAIGLFDVLEHIKDDAGFLAGIRPLLREDGRLYLTVPAHPILWSIEDEQAGHFRRYTRKGLVRLLASSGFEIEFSTHIFSFLWVPVFLMRTIVSRLGHGKRDLSSRETNEHGTPRGLTSWALNCLEKGEVRRLASAALAWGTSLLAVARLNGPLKHDERR